VVQSSLFGGAFLCTSRRSQCWEMRNVRGKMHWHSLMMADHELFEFVQDFEREYRQELDAGQGAGYTLYARRGDAGDHVLVVPPEALHVFERIASWKPRLRRCEAAPDLAGFKAVPVR
jgi:hypothetical protein